MSSLRERQIDVDNLSSLILFARLNLNLTTFPPDHKIMTWIEQYLDLIDGTSDKIEREKILTQKFKLTSLTRIAEGFDRSENVAVPYVHLLDPVLGLMGFSDISVACIPTQITRDVLDAKIHLGEEVPSFRFNLVVLGGVQEVQNELPTFKPEASGKIFSRKVFASEKIFAPLV
ncbi:hypothetical protein HY407_00795 [Candidatus Gottesmanbacteria bacterium]|nr:hypothetical protein [Candidatus Gottesmanbacteria bacterium]